VQRPAASLWAGHGGGRRGWVGAQELGEGGVGAGAVALAVEDRQLGELARVEARGDDLEALVRGEAVAFSAEVGDLEGEWVALVEGHRGTMSSCPKRSK
jgi:hypothetical protein